MLSRYWLRGRRRGGRRQGETSGIYVDRYARTEVAVVLTILALAVADVVLTGMHLHAGGAEVNPWLDALLARFGLAAMAAAKLAVTGGALFVLLLHVRWRIARAGLVGLCVLHLALLCWHTVVAIDRITA